ncbi:hypothetical protein ACFLZC_02365 [Patescibacteria group bacterium]
MPTNEERAQSLLKELDRTQKGRKTKRPFFIEITGSPDSGKSTIIDILDPFFRRQNYNVFTPQEGAEAIRHIPRTSHLYNIRTGLYALVTLIDASVNEKYDLVIFDRCLHDAISWLGYWVKKKDIDINEAVLLENFFCFPTWFDMLDASFFVITTPEEAIRRDQSVSLTKKFGGTTNPESIKNLVEIFTKTFETQLSISELKKELFNKEEKIFLIDTTNMERAEMAEMVLEKTLSALEKRFT